MFTTRCFIRKNSKELQEKLAEIGYEICPCCNFEGSVWLNNYLMSSSVHGIGYVSEDSPFSTTEGMLNLFLMENEDPKYSHCHSIDCGTNEELFLALASLRDDSDKHQWFIEKDDFHTTWWMCDLDKISDCYQSTKTLRKATAEELIEYFKDK